jgi:membrane-bound ClpP family serine protease
MPVFIEYLSGWSLPAVLCLLVGLGLLIFEMFTPGIGAPGVLGIIALIAAVVLRADTLQSGLITFALILVIVIVSGAVIFRSAAHGRISRSPIVLNDSIKSGSTSLSDEQVKAMVGREGTTVNMLRPAGNAVFDGKRMDVVTSGELVEAGKRVRIERIDGTRIVVKEVRS